MKPSARTVIACALAVAAGCKYDWPLDTPNAGDGGNGPDANADATVPGDGAAPGQDGATAFSCDGALFCDDFDGAALKPHWDDVFTGSAGSMVQIDALAGAPSPPNAFFASRAAGTVSQSAAYATTVLKGTLEHARLEFKIRPETVDADPAKACVAGFVFNEDNDATSHLARILVGGAKATLQEKVGATYNSYDMAAVPSLKKWSHMVLTIDVPGQIVVTMDNVEIFRRAADSSWTASTSTRIILGINFLDTAGTGFAFHFDDLRFDGS